MNPGINTFPVARQMLGYYTTHLASYNMKGLATSGEIDDALWSALEYYSEIEEVGIAFLIQKGILKKDAQIVFKRFQAFIRQAKNYYYSAKTLHYRSASLLYYYCFLNLAKAGLLIRQSSIANQKLMHGMSVDINKNYKNFDDIVIKFVKDGPRTPISARKQIFPMLYESYFGQQLTLDVANISKLFGYISDVGEEYLKCGYGDSKLFFGVHTSAMNENDKTTWAIVGIHQGARLMKYKQALLNFYNEFEKIDLDKNLAKEIWGMDSAVHPNYQFYQSINPRQWIGDNIPYPPSILGQEVIKSFNNMFQSNVFSEKTDFFLASPYSINKQVPMNEPLATYLIMYYLGSLVRYKPDFLEALINKKENWLIESFVKTAPLTFLREFVPWIIELEYRFKHR
jgi:hypothetical protein